MKKNIIHQISSGNMKSFSSILQSHWKVDGDVLSEAVKFGLFHNEDSILAFVDALKDDKKLWEDRFKLFSMLPDTLQSSEEVGITLLESGYFDYFTILEKIPSLYESKRAIIAMVYIANYMRMMAGSDDLVQKSPFCGDKEVMIAACTANDDNLYLANKGKQFC